MKILIADKLSQQAVNALVKLGADVKSMPDLSAEELPQHVANVEILIVRSTKVKAETIAAAPRMSLIIRAGAGVNTIALEEASNRGIHVANCPGKNTDAVAELAIGLLVAADRRIVEASTQLRAGRWQKKEFGKASGLKGRTLGIIGAGAIGMAVAERAKGLKMNVIAWSRSLTPETAEALGIGFCATPNEVAAKADAISLHLAAAAETRHLVNEQFLAEMKDGAILINTSRGEVVDSAALKKAIETKKLRVGTDVFENEPAGGDAEFNDTELASMIACTPHIGASTDQAAEAIAAETVRIVKSYIETGKPVNVVNVNDKSSAPNTLVVTHFNRVGVLANVLDSLRKEGINVEEMDNAIFSGGKAAACSLHLDKQPSAATIENIAQMENIIKVVLK
jgi:D-3-phosphoglycerate dehydrogenase